MPSVIKNPYARPIGEYVKETAMKNLHVHPLLADALAGFLRPEPMRPITFTDAAELEEMPVCDPPINPLSDRDGD